MARDLTQGSIPHHVLALAVNLLAISLSLGPSGIFWAITISTIAKGTVVFIWFRSGSWKKQKI